MNTKLLAGISLAAMAGSFWACGEGPINSKEFSDTIVESLYGTPDELEALKEQAKTDCWQNDPSCAMLYESYVNPNASNPTPSSAAPILSSASGPIIPPTVSSSSEEVINNHGRSSSSIVFASSAVEVSSSSETVPATGLGSCKPTKNPIKKGESTTWSFSRNSSNNIAASKYQGNATYQWEFVGGSIPDDNTKFTSAEVTYMNSGEVTAAVTVTLTDGSSEKITCAPLQVNGDDITGCECNPTAETIDIKQNAVATWAVTGCETTSMPLTYEWDADIAGDGANGGYQFTEAGVKTPVVTVKNSDNTSIKVTCGAVKATNGPEYLFELVVPKDNPSSQQLPKTELEVEDGGCMSIQGEWKNDGYKPSIQVLCSGTADDASKGMTFSMTYNSKSIVDFATEKDQGWGFSNQGGLIGSISVGENDFSNICVTFTGAKKVSCHLQ